MTVNSPLPARETQAPVLVPFSHAANADGGAVATKFPWKPLKPFVVDRVSYLNVTGLAEHASNWCLLAIQKSLIFADLDASAVSTANDTLAFPTEHGLFTGDGPMRLTTTGGAPTGLATGVDYYVIRNDRLTIKLATTRDNALRGTTINITGAGTGVQTIVDTATSKRVIAYLSTDADLPGSDNGIAANTTVELTLNDAAARIVDTTEQLEFLADEAGTTTLPAGGGVCEGRYLK